MERRRFLGSLLALPILAGLKPKSVEPLTMKMVEKVLNSRIDDPVWQSLPCSGTFITGGSGCVAGSGVIHNSGGCSGPFIRREDIIW